MYPYVCIHVQATPFSVLLLKIILLYIIAGQEQI